MQKIFLALLAGGLIGSAATYILSSNPTTPGQRFVAERDIEYIPEISVSKAEAHREDRYASIKTIEDTLALPTDFAETEALYVIAGRQDAFGVQELIEQATRVNDSSDRRAAIRILLSRLTELDPFVALETARSFPLNADSNFEKAVWTTWGRLNLDEALSVAKSGTYVQKTLAAQSLYSSVREFDEEKMSHIKTTLGIAPNRNTRAQKIYALAADSPTKAIRFIESRGSVTQQREELGMLARYLSQSNPTQLANYADLIQSATHRRYFEQAMSSYGVTSDPEAALDKLINEPNNPRVQSQGYRALQNLAKQDPDKAFAFLENISDQTIRLQSAVLVAQSVAETDPRRALAWAKENAAKDDLGQILPSIIGQMAQNDPQLALEEARLIPTAKGRALAVQMVISVSMQGDPAIAADMLGIVEEPATRLGLVAQLAQVWGQNDFDAAVQWVSSLGEQDQRAAIQGIAQQAVNNDVNQAIALLDQFPAAASPNLRAQIASSLAHQDSIDAAQSYIEQYRGTPGYARLQVSVMSIAARSDPDRAMQMADSVQDVRQRDQLVSSIVAQKASKDPQMALQWMQSITDSSYRQQALSHIANAWNQKSPAEARSWAQSLPRGDDRDNAILAVSASGRNPGLDSLELINTIDDATKRKQDSMTLVMRLVHSQPAEAEKLLSTLDLSEAERSQYQQMLDTVLLNQGMRFD